MLSVQRLSPYQPHLKPKASSKQIKQQEESLAGRRGQTQAVLLQREGSPLETTQGKTDGINKSGQTIN